MLHVHLGSRKDRGWLVSCSHSLEAVVFLRACEIFLSWSLSVMQRLTFKPSLETGSDSVNPLCLRCVCDTCTGSRLDSGELWQRELGLTRSETSWGSGV